MKFFIEAFGYKFQAEFDICFNDEKTDIARCVALEPPEKIAKGMPWALHYPYGGEYYLSPEIFISEGTLGSVVGDWVQSRGGFSGIHHLAYQVDDVEAKMKEWTDNGWANFSSAEPITCPGLVQVFSKPNCTGVVYEFIKREGHGFCKESVKTLMLSSKGD